MPQSDYDPRFLEFGGGPTQTILHPAVVAAVILIGLLVFLLPRKYIAVPLFLGLLLIPARQLLYFNGFHLYVYRILLLLGWTRLFVTSLTSSKDLLPGGFGTLDKLFTVWATYRATSFVLHFMQVGAITNQVAFLWDALGGYFLFRCLIRNEKDILRVLKAFAVVAVVASAGMVYEQVTRQNLFAFLGGIRPAPEIRNGRIRSQAMFAHALLAGSFGATMFPLFFWLWKRGRSWFFGILGAAAAVVMVFTASTSTPIITFMAGLLVFCVWPIRKNMRLVRWGIIGGLVVLQLLMKKPVWFVMDHIDLAGGSAGWDRAMLIDNFFRHIGYWWLIGTHDYVNWGDNMWDQCNQFVLEGERGGLIAFICFVAMFAVCFRKIGNARKVVEGDPKKEWFIWIFGTALFAQAMAYFGIDYFDQTQFVWYGLLVMISVITLAPDAKVAPAPGTSRQPMPLWVVRSPATSGAASETWAYEPTRSRWISH
jgi:hypothetical protein